MANTIIPVLSVNTDRLTTPQQQIAYILRHMFYNPGWTSSQIEQYLISMRKLLAENQHDRDAFRNALQSKLQSIISNAYPSFKVIIKTPQDKVETNRYNVDIYITDEHENLILSNMDVYVEDGRLKLKYESDINEKH